MFDVKTLNEQFSALQQSGINCGGIWTVRVFDKTFPDDNALLVLKRVFGNHPKYDNSEQYTIHAEKGGWNPEESRSTKNLKLIELADWEHYFEQRIEHWSHFELISREEMTLRFDPALYAENKERFTTGLFACFGQRNLLQTYKIDENTFDTYELWKEQIVEDFVFELENEILIVSFGWSS